MKFYGDIELIGGKILNLVVGDEDTLEISDVSSPFKLVAFDNKLYFNDGITGYRLIQFSENDTASPLITSLGNWFNDDLSFDPTPFNALDNVSGLTSDDSLLTVIQQLDSAISNVTQESIADLEGIVINGQEDGDILLSVSGTFVNLPLEQAIQNFGNVNIVSLEDYEESTSLQNNDVLSWNSTMTKFTNKKCFYRYSSNYSQSSYIISHNLGKQYCIVQCIDKSTNQKISSNDYTIVYNNSNMITVTFNQNIIAEILVFSLD